MSEKPAEVSTITGNTIQLLVDHDVRPGSPTSESGSIPRADHSPEDFRRCEDDDFTKISLNGLVEKTLSDPESEIGRQMRKCLADGDPIPKTLIYTALKQALDHVDPTRPVLLVDRRLSFDTKAIRLNESTAVSSATQTESGQSPACSHRKMSNGTAVTGVSHEHHGSRAFQTPDVMESDKRHEAQTESYAIRALKVLKHALFPPDEPIPASEKGEDTSNIVIRYFKKMRGGQKRPPYERPLEALQSLIVSFVGMLILTVIDFHVLNYTDYTLVIGSFGATAVLIFCAIKSPLAQPRNVFGGHALAAVIGAAFQVLLGQQYPWLAAALAVSVSIAVMSLTNTVHPPAGATALIAVYSNDKIHKIGFMYVLTPVLSGAAILVLVAVLMNNLFPSRRYPMYWF